MAIRETFRAIPKSIARRKDFEPKTKLVTGILWTKKDSDFEAFSSRRYIAEALEVSKDTVNRAIKEFKEKGLIKSWDKRFEEEQPLLPSRSGFRRIEFFSSQSCRK